jgi:hypothetical protein
MHGMSTTYDKYWSTNQHAVYCTYHMPPQMIVIIA